MVMEFVSGVNLEQFIEQHRTLRRKVPVDFAVFIASRIARGLTYAHQKTDRDGHHLNIVHRDVNPKNVMVNFEGDVKLTDFGIAKAFNLMYNEEGKVIPGKDEYCSPEQASYAVTDARADLFSLGIVLTELLLLRNVFRADDRLQSRRNVLSMPIPTFGTLRPEIDAKLEAIVRKALERDRTKRYQMANDLLTDLELYLYSDRYGPTNEKLGVYIRELFGQVGSASALVSSSVSIPAS